MPAAEFESRFVLLRIERPRPVEIDSAPGADTTHREQLEGRRLRATHLPGESVIKGDGRSRGKKSSEYTSLHQLLPGKQDFPEIRDGIYASD